MKLRNKKTGEIGHFTSTNWNEIALIIMDDNGVQLAKYSSLAELNAEWEDYEEPKEWWYIDIHGPHKVTNNDEYYQKVKDASKEIGNYFETEEEAELAVRKLKAWKRLKDKGFRFRKWDWLPDQNIICGNIGFYIKDYNVDTDDLGLLFGGEK